MNNKAVETYYNNFVERQKISGVNDRIFSLYKRLIKLGLNKSSNVLELGCGIGSMTYLLSKTVKKGTIEAVDISTDSIQVANSKIKKSNIHFFVHDIVDYQPEYQNFDFILLFDIMEHIPQEKHLDLFKNVSNQMHENTILVVNIPNPDYIEYDQKEQPDVLQIIDQPIQLDFIINNIVSAKLDLIFFEKYSIWVKDEYCIYILNKKRHFVENILDRHKNICRKFMTKVFRLKLKFFYPY